MKLTAAGAILLILAICSAAQRSADLVIINASVRTLDARAPRAEAVAVSDGRIIAVGNNAAIQGLIGERTWVIDARGMDVFPGFNDSHVHFMAIGNMFSSLDARNIRSPEAFIAKLRPFTVYLPKRRWILGSGIHPTLAEKIDLKLIDSITGENPLLIYSADGRSALANSAAFERAGIRGEPAAIVDGTTLGTIRRVVPADHTRRYAEIAETASNYAVAHGITSVQDTDSDDHAELYRQMAKNGTLKVRIYDCHGLPKWKLYADAGLKAATGSSMVREGCLKGTADVDEAAKSTLQRDVIAADKAGMQVLIHAIGEQQVAAALDVFEEAIRVNGKRDRRFRIEHAARASPEDIERFARLGIIASMQPHLFRWEFGDAYHFRQVKNAGVRIAFGSDAPMTDIDPLLGVTAAWKGITFADSLSYYTKGSAYAEFQENFKGSLVVGSLADMVVIDRAATETPRVKMTVVDGNIVYRED